MATNPPPQKPPQKPYHIKFAGHICLTAYESTPRQDHLIIRQIVEKVFEEGHFHSDHLQKTQRFYEFIIVDTNSIDIKHNLDQDNRIAYSKCTIKDVIGPSRWKDPFAHKSFSQPFDPPSFNYNDYRMAWFKAFLLRPNLHSWFFNFHNHCTKDFPIWITIGGPGLGIHLIFYQMMH